jgi:hypothetical protein
MLTLFCFYSTEAGTVALQLDFGIWDWDLGFWDFFWDFLV